MTMANTLKDVNLALVICYNAANHRCIISQYATEMPRPNKHSIHGGLTKSMRAPNSKPYKVVLIGRQHTGKTSIINQFMRREFSEAYNPTALATQQIAMNMGQSSCRLQIWDTAGCEDWQALNTSVYHGANAIIYVASYDELESLEELESFWMKKVDEHVKEKEYHKILAVNKSDLEESARQFCSDHAKEWAENHKIEIIEVSAKENTNIQELFTRVANALTKLPPEPTPTVDIVADTVNTKKPWYKRWCDYISNKC